MPGDGHGGWKAQLRTPEPKPEKLLFDMRDRLEGVVRTKTTGLHAACERAAVKANELFLAQQEYNELKERIDRPMEETPILLVLLRSSSWRFESC